MKPARQLLLLLWFVTPSLAQDPGWIKEWNEILAAAKKEGKVVVRGFAGPDARQGPAAKFTARFGIPVEYMTGRASEVAARLRTERNAGVYSTDVFLAGIDTIVTILYREKMLEPLRPALVHPEVVDPSKWKSGKLWFVDPEGKYILRLLNYVSGMVYINTQYVKIEEFRSIRDLLNLKWKGKISAQDPTVPGGGSNGAAQLYLQFGEEFVKKLYVDQEILFSRNLRQLADWLARGTYPISLNTGDAYVRRLQEDGFPIIEMIGLPDAPGTLSAGSGLLALMNNAPHPNAAKLFVNWMASREGLEAYARAQSAATTRNDIDESFVSPGSVPRPGVNYFDGYGWEFTVRKEEIRLQLKRILGPR
jgi:ABC-type Fe3+ transport system substrate-binding protein